MRSELLLGETPRPPDPDPDDAAPAPATAPEPWPLRVLAPEPGRRPFALRIRDRLGRTHESTNLGDVVRRVQAASFATSA